jgi:hypothetical protein
MWRFVVIMRQFDSSTQKMAEAQKKVIVRRFNASTVSGYMPANGFLDSNIIALMDTEGRAILFPINEIKWIAYVRDFNPEDLAEPERLGRRTFPARPRTEGLWLRMIFRDGDALEGLAALDITFLDSIVTDHGLMATVPDARSNTQRIYVPRSALTSLGLLGVITSPTRRKTAQSQEPQPRLFSEG